MNHLVLGIRFYLASGCSAADKLGGGSLHSFDVGFPIVFFQYLHANAEGLIPRTNLLFWDMQRTSSCECMCCLQILVRTQPRHSLPYDARSSRLCSPETVSFMYIWPTPTASTTGHFSIDQGIVSQRTPQKVK